MPFWQVHEVALPLKGDDWPLVRHWKQKSALMEDGTKNKALKKVM